MPLIDRDTDLAAWIETHSRKASMSDLELSTLVSWKTIRAISICTLL